MSKLSLKIGTYFLILALCIETIAFVSFYKSISTMRIEEETLALLEKGNRYSKKITSRTKWNVIAKEKQHPERAEYNKNPNRPMYPDFDIADAAAHLVESELIANSDIAIILTDNNGKIISTSEPVTKAMQKQLICKTEPIPKGGLIVEKNWKKSKFITTVSPLNTAEFQGKLYMLLKTSFLENMLLKLMKQFLIIGVLTIILTTISVFVFSRVITEPLIKMKRATEKISKLNTPIQLGIKRNDELGSLAKTIEDLSSELTYMKKERNEFLASVAHELLTPLTYMKGYAKVAKRDSLTKEEREEYLQIIEDETDSVTDLVQDLFMLVQLEQHQFVIKKQKVILQPFLERMVEKTKTTLTNKQMQLHVYCKDDLEVCIDERRMEQVMLNLLHNAYQHSPENTTITIRVLTETDSFIISVADEGEGIPEEDIPHIFDRFYRVDKSRTRATGGKGIGLAVAKEIVELHNGSILVTSQLGVGTNFIIELPFE
ncbi:two-component sensor histidine kinase [Bacillus wiedmannii]|uniref:sensor histidine kinase n=1 Tax=Bacillus wiedmannii TaxID=1890302 RepID=UPI000BF9EFA9|nr:HAMP domain-containing sensor histidine kinase [Bacillus wiedmannii]PEP25523.1 two-component sensor histidine kinase [Bacillus wiedmannii]PEP94507.1 two-component sensor histidine kinase [Bacillus wiedmannii]PFY72238.1 two-component sensor histidine kinase [Bacillus wiedmannii]PHF06454.1 two-component sensor histidine kinase [Bacillus wiedmannii]PHF94393.1 two-component sensor histidine kinase [Bacillus wiedmannii]